MLYIGIICIVIGLVLPHRKLTQIGAILVLIDVILSALAIVAFRHLH